VADDDPLVVKFLRQVLPASRYDLVEAKTGLEVITLLGQSRYDAILLDLRMPSGSGYDVLRAVTGDHRHAGLPIVVLTNYPTPRDASERDLLSSSVVVDLLSKSAVAAHPEVLLDRLRQLSGTTPS
jgi:CheY-like chemotaxis protein